MKNDKGNLQAKSREAPAMVDYLMLIIQGYDNILKEFSFEQLVRPMEAFGHDEKTVRRISRKLEKNGIIKARRIAHGKKKFKIDNLENAKTFRDGYSNLNVLNRKYKPETRITPTKPIKNPPAKLSSNFRLILEIDGQVNRTWYYPKEHYYNKICPICSRKLVRSRRVGSITRNELTHDLDKKCRNCKSEFYYNRPSEKFATDDSIKIISSSENINQYLLCTLVDENKMKILRKEIEKLLEKVDKWKNSFR